jgi:hypothetical protein
MNMKIANSRFNYMLRYAGQMGVNGIRGQTGRYSTTYDGSTAIQAGVLGAIINPIWVE